MAVSIGNIMRHCRNYFEQGYYDGNFTIQDGAFKVPDLPIGRYIAVSGSAYNDGVHRVGEAADELTDEAFTGRVWLLSPPASFLALAKQISEYDDKNPVDAMQSESFGAYSYSRGASGTSVVGAAGWRGAFAAQLRDYQRLTSEVMA